jgi:hypothetical protein|tara:strand:- start:469 stop:699 length:231 start_codon:yes stop_codon:yes gene_type:complete
MAYNESPVENQNKGYAGQEKKDLMNDNPIAKDASGGRPTILKHMSGSKGSPLHSFEGGLHAKNVKHSKDGEHLGKK